MGTYSDYEFNKMHAEMDAKDDRVHERKAAWRAVREAIAAGKPAEEIEYLHAEAKRHTAIALDFGDITPREDR